MKIILNKCYGGFDVSKEASILYAKKTGLGLPLDEEHRQDPILIEVVEELGDKASGVFGRLEVVEIPDNCYYKIDEYDGMETISYSNSEIYEK